MVVGGLIGGGGAGICKIQRLVSNRVILYNLWQTFTVGRGMKGF